MIAVLLAIIADNARMPLRSAVWYPARYAAALTLFIAAYYGAHAELFGTLIGLAS